MTARICAAALICAILGAVLSEMGFRSKKLFAVLVTVILTAGIGESLFVLFGKFASISEIANVGDAATCIIKTVGVGYVFGFTADVCTELGEGGIAGAVTAAGRVEVLMIAFPYFERMIDLGVELLG